MKTQEVEPKDFVHWSSFYFSICSWMRGYMEYPKVKEHYENFKPFVGKRSLIMRPMTLNFFIAFRGEKVGKYKIHKETKSPQYWISRLLYNLENEQREKEVFWIYPSTLKGILQTVPEFKLKELFNCTAQKPPTRERYPNELRVMARDLLQRECYSEVGVLGDWCEDFGLYEEANHFRHPNLTHTYGCRFLQKVSCL